MNRSRTMRRRAREPQKKGANSKTGAPGLEDYELAEVRGFSPDRLQSSNGEERQIDGLMLALALVFNDLKDALWFRGRLSPGFEAYPEGTLSAQRGQLSGMTLGVMREVASVVFELLKLLSQHQQVVSCARFTDMIRLLDDDARDRWRKLNEDARGSYRDGPPMRGTTAWILKEVRDKFGSHYDVGKLQAGYVQHFAENATDPSKTTAYYSDGKNQERSRFYFADAAAEGVFEAHVGLTRKQFEDQMRDLVWHVNITLKHVLIAWLHARGAWRPEYDER